MIAELSHIVPAATAALLAVGVAWASGTDHMRIQGHGRGLFLASVALAMLALFVAYGSRDSDGSPQGGDACGSVHESAAPKADAQPQEPTP